ncbi:hypothetical protein SELMODRAFT_411339 [Selaginella moellendorffii]|uniref:Uncharacterized protein n=1 Tax=Selaginella moellendorffii TaxID=88036 RepID=D8RHB9_SELML|nr:hypothetical protein SELMODRAFT_411339 [Selaginella moellendorffii]
MMQSSPIASLVARFCKLGAGSCPNIGNTPFVLRSLELLRFFGMTKVLVITGSTVQNLRMSTRDWPNVWLHLCCAGHIHIPSAPVSSVQKIISLNPGQAAASAKTLERLERVYNAAQTDARNKDATDSSALLLAPEHRVAQLIKLMDVPSGYGLSFLSMEVGDVRRVLVVEVEKLPAHKVKAVLYRHQDAIISVHSPPVPAGCKQIEPARVTLEGVCQLHQVAIDEEVKVEHIGSSYFEVTRGWWYSQMSDTKWERRLAFVVLKFGPKSTAPGFFRRREMGSSLVWRCPSL